jgi:hypothetical protein
MYVSALESIEGVYWWLGLAWLVEYINYTSHLPFFCPQTSVLLQNIEINTELLHDLLPRVFKIKNAGYMSLLFCSCASIFGASARKTHVLLLFSPGNNWPTSEQPNQSSYVVFRPQILLFQDFIRNASRSHARTRMELCWYLYFLPPPELF